MPKFTEDPREACCGIRLGLDSGCELLTDAGKDEVRKAKEASRKYADADEDWQWKTMSERDAAGICYDVRVEGCDRGFVVWHRRVLFGSTEAARAGGRAFQMAAEDCAAAAFTAYGLWRALD